GYSITALVYCTTQLEQPLPGGDGCAGFADDEDDGVCYQIITEVNNWNDARMTCRKAGGELASIHNQKENDFVRRFAVSRGIVDGLVLGATTQQDGTFTWVDGSPMDYENYFPGFPKKNFGDCIAMDVSSTSGQWMNVDCASKFPVACMRQRESAINEISEYISRVGLVITSPGYPFSSSTPCDYFLSVAPGKTIEVEILSLEANSCCDSLIIYDAFLGGRIVSKSTGIVTNHTFTGATNQMRVSWKPDGGVNVKGMVIVHGSCPPGYELIKDGECRGYQDKRTVYFNDAARIAIETCEKIQGQPPIIHDEE
ncbi:hypothetical protein PMAYCL1PPCAC_22252, partial [Pristionchus mayeri]